MRGGKGVTVGVLLAMACVLTLAGSPRLRAAPFLQKDLTHFQSAPIVPVVVFGRNSRRSVDDFAADYRLDADHLRRDFVSSGLIECGQAHGAGQLTLTNDVVTTAAHVLFDEHGRPRAKNCSFIIEMDGKPVSVPINLKSVVAGSKDPYSIAAVHDWAVARLAYPIEGAVPFSLAETVHDNEPVEFVARGHIDWGDGHRLSMEKCHLHDQLSIGSEGTREFSFDCETGDGASGGAVVTTADKPVIGAILVGWRSDKPFHSAPFSNTHYNFAVSIEGAFKQAVINAATHPATAVATTNHPAKLAARAK
ncbi:trypsin-like peptidase domain-containing protein [Beijerinckia indica]|uniref:Serine protease n=1 Tax=Beijerinckia indica subsp. indica (strain ATCC 9039 / DSM 1715 / NCIMB 8712) TaxID=395963 RepID=B2IG82_BEII9|nr:trypsin-like peptidase domain-containing protein [Beijerinckia indica]ACB97156.1 hypothetical protein Bind_3601 [Beijerinckia indica subsp. indica ATCC 9039]